MNSRFITEGLDKYNDSKIKSEKKGKVSIEKFNFKFKDKKKKIRRKNISSDNFWKVDLNNEENFENNITYYKNINETKKPFACYEKYRNLLIKERNQKYYNALNKNICLFKRKNKCMNKKDNTVTNDYINKSVDMSKMNRNKKHIKFEESSFLDRNNKWIEYKKKKINKSIEQLIEKKEKEIMENTSEYKINKKDIYTVFNEEENVTFRPENFRFFMRLIQGRQEKERSLTFYDKNYYKINCLKNSHYSGRRNGSISQREMNKYIKYIRNELNGMYN